MYAKRQCWAVRSAPTDGKSNFMTRDPVDLSAHRSAQAKEASSRQRRCLLEFKRELAKLRKDQEQFVEGLTRAISQFEEDGPRAWFDADGTSGLESHAALAGPVAPGYSDVAFPSDARSGKRNEGNASRREQSTVPVCRLNSIPARPLALPGDAKEGATTAIVYCEANFGSLDGKTANGLIRHSEKYKILAVIDSKKAGRDSGAILDDAPNGIPVCRNLAEALHIVQELPDHFIYGIAPSSGRLSGEERRIVLSAIGMGMNIVSGLHEFLGDDAEFADAARAGGVTIADVRKPPSAALLRAFNGRIRDVTCPRIAILGTDCAIGKRTTASILTRALVDRGINAVMIGTGQTGLMQGARYGVALDAIPSQFCAGELEALIIDAFEREDPDVIIVEGQGALSHPAYSTSALILRGSQPNGVILQHAPGRRHRCDFAHMPMPTPRSEIGLIQAFSGAKVIGLTINHENMSGDEVDAAIARYERNLKIPATDALSRSSEHLVAMVASAYPEIRAKLDAVIH
jgi:uncharacterized NAD-dependent epimerase/dehydratase family protein